MANGPRTAAASDHGGTVRRRHFGSAPLYVIFEVRDGEPERVEGWSPVEDTPEHGHGEALAVLRHLEDCAVFVGGRMGRRSRQMLSERGIVTHVTGTVRVEDAAGEALEPLG